MNAHGPLPEDSSAGFSTEHGPPPLVTAAEDESFEVFDLWMTVQLSQLVAKWERLAAPNARRAATVIGPRFGKPRKAK